MTDRSSGGFNGAAGGITSQTAFVYDENNNVVSTVAAVREDGEWKLYDGNRQPYDLPADHYLVWKTQCSTATQPPPNPTVQCYYREVPVSEPTGKPNNVANKGYIEQTLWTGSQFENAGNVGSTDADFHALVTLDEDGVPTVNGEYVQSNVTSMTRSEGGANGELIRFEGYLYNPIRYPDRSTGRYVAKAELVDTYTGTTQADYAQLFVATRNGNYTLSRRDLVLVDDNPAPGDSIYTLDPSQRGEWLRFAYVNGDQGGASQFNIQMRLTYADGSVQVLALQNFLHQVGPVAYHAETTLEPLVFDTVAGTWTKEGNPETVDTSLGNLKETPCGQLPITFNVWNEAGTVTFSGVFGGSQTGYEYSIDGGKTFQSSSTFDLSESGAVEVVPVVRDSNGTLSARQGLSTHFPCIEKAWSADFTTPAINDTVYDDGAGHRGWAIEYSRQLGGDHLESTNSAANLSWNLVNATRDANFIYLGNTFVSPNSSASADLLPLLPVAENGQTYVLAFNPYNYYHGYPGTESTLLIEVIDKDTGAVLGSRDFVWLGNTTANLSNEWLEFVGAGHAVSVRLSLVNTNTVSGDWWGDTARVNATATQIIKNYSGGWNVGVRSAKAGKVAAGVNLKFKPVGTGNKGMHGLDSDYAGSSYAGVDYAFYLHNNNGYLVYENGANRFSGTYTGSAVFEIDIAPDGTVTYKVNGAVVYTSTVNAGNGSYWVASHPYTNGQGITAIQFDGTDTVEIPDAANHYVRIDNLRLFEGLYSDASHHAKKAGNHYLFFRGIGGKAVYTSDAHGYAVDTTIVPKFDIRRYGTLENVEDRVVLEYQIDSGAWVTILDHDGQFDVANKLYLSPFYFEKGVRLPAGKKIRYRMTVHGTGDAAEGYRLYENSDVVRC